MASLGHNELKMNDTYTRALIIGQRATVRLSYSDMLQLNIFT